MNNKQTGKEQKLFERPDVRQRIQGSLYKSRATNKEYGFNFYFSDGKLITADIVEGDAESISIKDIKSKQPRDTKLVGAFHAHTRSTNGDVIPSPSDIKKGLSEDFNFFCVGASLDDHEIVRCFTKGDLEEEMKEIFEDLKLEKSKENLEKLSRMIAARMTVDKGYLDEHSHKRIYKR